MNRRIVLATMGAVVALAMVSAQPLYAASGGGSDPNVTHTRFGSLLTVNDQPQNAPRDCANDVGNNEGTCTWVMNQAMDRSTPKAPKNGTIAKIRLIANNAGHIKIQIAKINSSSQAKIVTNGPRLDFNGQPSPRSSRGTFVIETFNVNITIKKGQVLAFKAGVAQTLSCNSGGVRTMLYQPVLPVGGGFEDRDGDNGCFMLVEAEYSN